MKVMKKHFSVYLFVIFLISILPTLVFGILGVYTQMNNVIWVWNIISVFLYFLILTILAGEIRIGKKYAKYLILFLVITVIQYIVYYNSIRDGYIEPIYSVLPVTYCMHFLNTLLMIQEGEKAPIDLRRFLKWFVIFVIAACIYNMIINFKYFFDVHAITNKYINISSFFHQRNAFGQLCLFGIIANTLLIKKDKTKINKISQIIIIINLLFSFSRTSIIAAILFLCVNALLDIKAFNKKNIPKIIMVILALFCLLVIAFSNNGFVSFLDQYVIREGDGLSGRDKVWSYSLSKINSSNVIWGYGLGATPALLSGTPLLNTHNTVIETILSGGLLLLAFYIAIFAKVIKEIVSIKHSAIKNTYISAIVCIFAYMFFEKVLLFGVGYAPVMISIFVFVLPIIDRNYYDYRNMLRQKEYA